MSGNFAGNWRASVQFNAMTTDTGQFDPLLVADVGGTFARFAVWSEGRVGATTLTLERSAADSLSALCAQAIRKLDICPVAASIAVAGPVTAGSGILTNVGWTFSEHQLEQDLALRRVVLVNDYSALALSLPALGREDVLVVAPRNHEIPDSAEGFAQPRMRVVFGPGTGLGVAGLIQGPGGMLAVDSEGGHTGFAPSNELELALHRRILEMHGRCAWESVLSGPGLELIDAVGRHRRTGSGSTSTRSAREIIEAARAGHCADAIAAIGCFSDLLGSFAGDLALAFRATEGVYIGGGLVTRMLDLLTFARVRERFHGKGRQAVWLDFVPLYVIRNSSAALTGAGIAFARAIR